MSTEAATSLALHEISLYNTGRVSPEKVVAAFAARQEQFQRIVDDLAAEKPQGRPQHHLVVGQRGMGKTMLLARIAAELRLEPLYRDRFVPLVFAEEQYAVDRLSKFWLNCLDSLADAREMAGDTASVDEIDETVMRLISRPAPGAKEDQAFADEVYAAFAEAVARTGQRPVLLVDNLQLVFERLESSQQHALRELLMRAGAPILVGASPSPPPQSQDYGAAFYDHFKVHYLRPLEEAEMRDLLLRLAEVAQRDDVRRRVIEHPARLKVLRQLTGGNPRTTLTLFFLYAEDFAPSVFGDLEGLLDRVTPLYKARFEELTAQQQVIASAIANHWDPVTAAVLAERTALPAGTISAQLDRLEKAGVIERVELFGESRTGYQIAERFFNIWFLMRSASRRQRREVEFLTRFLESFYEPGDRSRLAQHLMGEGQISPDRYLWRCAVADSLDDPQTSEELKRHTELLVLRDEAVEARRRMRELIDLDSLPPATLAFDELRKKLVTLVPEEAGISPVDFANTVLGDRSMFMTGERERLGERREALSDFEVNAILESTFKSRLADLSHYEEGAINWLSKRLESGQLRNRLDAEDWNRSFLLSDDKDTTLLLVETLPSDSEVSIIDKVFEKICSHLVPNRNGTANEWNTWGHYSHSRLGRYKEAIYAFRKAINRDPSFAVGYVNLGGILMVYDGDRMEAEKIYREYISRDSSNSKVWLALGHLLLSDPSRGEEAESALVSAIESSHEEVWAWVQLAILYCESLDRLMDSQAAFDRALEIKPNDSIILQRQIFLHRDYLGKGSDAGGFLNELTKVPNHRFPDTTILHAALFAAYDSNWGLAREALSEALEFRANGFIPFNTDDWLRASAVLVHLNYGKELLAFLEGLGDTAARLRPWVEAIRAIEIGDMRALQNIAPEIRTTAEIFYDGIERRLSKLPEKTRRRPQPKPKKTRPRKK